MYTYWNKTLLSGDIRCTDALSCISVLVAGKFQEAAAMTTINLDDVTAEVSPEELEEAETGIEPKEVDTQHSPFAHLMSNLLQGGGRQRKQGYRGRGTRSFIAFCCRDF